jgi:CheY-like chemotaxis protein/HPt (histidine-containing phosphotransfer) domain-containing protein
VAGPMAGDTASSAPLRILLADDNPINQKVGTRLLERLGYGADVVGDGRQVLARLEQASYDAILMDVQMPEMDGLEASRAICARWAAGVRPRIIAMTAEAMQGDREKCLAAGMDDYVVKPVTLDRLAAALAKCHPLPDTVAAPPAAARTAPAADDPQPCSALDREMLDQLREDLGGTAALHDVIGTFLQETPPVLATLRDAAAQADATGLRKAAHKIKGASSFLGARALSDQCMALERDGQTCCPDDAAARVSAIEAAYRTIEAELKAEIDKPPA